MNVRSLKKLHFLIASGPTREPLDPVRFISNYSTGVMGKYLAQAAKKRGHAVQWVQCPQDAQTALELHKKLGALLRTSDVLIMAAAVCDVRPAELRASKIKKDDLKNISFVKNPDILAELSKKKKKNQIFIGFGLESQNLFKNGAEKLRKKGLELIVLQKVRKNQTPFGDKSIEAFLLYKDKDKPLRRFGQIHKKKLAEYLIREAERLDTCKN